jgi:glucose-fructose oxidoreductase
MPTKKPTNARSPSKPARATRSAKPRRRIRYAVVGLGHIAQNAVLPAFANAPNSTLAALVSSDPTKLRRLGQKHNIKTLFSYDDYEKCLRTADLDAVYIALPNSMHERFTIAAARAGVHVLCEKPLAVTDDACREMVRACRNARVMLMTAYRLHFEAANLHVLELCRSRKLGDLRIFNSVFTQQVARNNSRLHAALGGGPLHDVGIYCINAARTLFASEPVEAIAWESTSADKRFREIPETVSAMLRFKRGQVATFNCSFGAAPASHYHIIGTKGVASLDCAYDYGFPSTLRVEIDGKETTRRFAMKDQFAAELIYFSNCILNANPPEPSGEEGAADVRVIRALEWSIARRRVAHLPPAPSHQGPTMRQLISRPPVRTPRLVHASAPTRD